MARWRVEGRRGMRRLPSGELAFTKHQNGTYRGPVISPYSLRTRIGYRATRGDRISLSLCVSSRTHEPLPCISPRRTVRRTRKMSGSSPIPAFTLALLNVKTHHPVKEFSLSPYYWQRAMRRGWDSDTSGEIHLTGHGKLLITEMRG